MLLRAAKAWAWLSGRSFVTPDDVQALARPTLRHRIKLRPEAELEGVSADGIVEACWPAWPCLAEQKRWTDGGRTAGATHIDRTGARVVVVAGFVLAWPFGLGFGPLMALLWSPRSWSRTSPSLPGRA